MKSSCPAPYPPANLNLPAAAGEGSYLHTSCFPPQAPAAYFSAGGLSPPRCPPSMSTLVSTGSEEELMSLGHPLPVGNGSWWIMPRGMIMRCVPHGFSEGPQVPQVPSVVTSSLMYELSVFSLPYVPAASSLLPRIITKKTACTQVFVSGPLLGGIQAKTLVQRDVFRALEHSV